MQNTFSTATNKRISNIFLICAVIMMSVAAYAAQAADFKDGVTHLSQQEFMQKITEENVVVIDVRTKGEYRSGHIEGAINLPHRSILKDPTLLDPYQGKDIIFYCHTGVRVKKVTDYLVGSKAEGANLFHLKGDIRAWRARRLPEVKPK